MAAPTGTSADTLKFLQALEESPYKHDFFMTLRRLESMHPDKPPFGTAARPGEEPVRLGQEPTLAFAPSTVASFRTGGKDRPHRLQSFFFGLFGPNAPLPLHLTEYVRDRERQEDDRTFRCFADVFHHRLLMLFYRAWANARPAISMDRRTPRRCDTYVGSTFGLAAPEFRDRDAVPDDAKLHLAGRFALQTRPAEGLLAILDEFMGLPFRLKEFVGEWARLAMGDHLLLGAPGSTSVLGQDAVIGQSVWLCQHKFRVFCGPLNLEDFNRLLPGRGSLERLRDLARGYVGLALEWDLNLILKHADVPACRLGSAGELGWTSWLGERTSMADADDVIRRPNAT
jgi:type VI secretion system protein ImpH